MADAVSLVFENAGARLELSPTCGAVLSLRGGDGAGLYLAADDRRHIPKAVEYDWMTLAATRLSLQTFCGDLVPDGAWRPDLAYVVRPYRGGWMEACAMYRDWVRTLPGFDHPPTRPARPCSFRHSRNNIAGEGTVDIGAN